MKRSSTSYKCFAVNKIHHHSVGLKSNHGTNRVLHVGLDATSSPPDRPPVVLGGRNQLTHDQMLNPYELKISRGGNEQLQPLLANGRGFFLLEILHQLSLIHI